MVPDTCSVAEPVQQNARHSAPAPLRDRECKAVLIAHVNVFRPHGFIGSAPRKMERCGFGSSLSGAAPSSTHSARGGKRASWAAVSLRRLDSVEHVRAAPATVIIANACPVPDAERVPVD